MHMGNVRMRNMRVLISTVKVARTPATAIFSDEIRLGGVH